MKYIRQSFVWSFIAVLALYPATSPAKAVAGAFAQEAASEELDGYITRSMKDWEVPGLAIAIVKDDRVVLAKGYGVRKLGDPAEDDGKYHHRQKRSNDGPSHADHGLLVSDRQVTPS